MLTIAIPTFDRNAQLARNVQRLLPQLTPECRLIVIDNGSEEPVSDTLCPLLRLYPAANVQVVRNPHNIGGVANVMRCFEMCQTDWLWILGDDDEPLPNAVETVLDQIDRQTDALFINFSSDIHFRDGEKVTNGLEPFVDAIDSFGNVLFLSTSVYRASRIQPQLRFGYHLSYSMMPQLALLLAALRDDDQTVLSDEVIVRWTPPPATQHWSAINECLGKMAILDLPIPHRVRMKLARRIGLPRLEDLLVQLLLTIEAGGDRAEARYLWRETTARMSVGRSGASFSLKRGLYGQLLRTPSLAIKIADSALRKRKGKGIHDIGLRSRHGRM